MINLSEAIEVLKAEGKYVSGAITAKKGITKMVTTRHKGQFPVFAIDIYDNGETSEVKMLGNMGNKPGMVLRSKTMIEAGIGA